MCHFNVTIFHPLTFVSYFSVFLNLSPVLNFYSSRFFYLPISIVSFTRLPNLSFYYLYFRFSHFSCLYILAISTARNSGLQLQRRCFTSHCMTGSQLPPSRTNSIPYCTYTLHEHGNVACNLAVE